MKAVHVTDRCFALKLPGLRAFIYADLNALANANTSTHLVIETQSPISKRSGALQCRSSPIHACLRDSKSSHERMHVGSCPGHCSIMLHNSLTPPPRPPGTAAQHRVATQQHEPPSACCASCAMFLTAIRHQPRIAATCCHDTFGLHGICSILH